MRQVAPDEFLDTRGCAELLGVSPEYVKRLRLIGGGPAYHRLSERAIRYQVADVRAWAASRRRAPEAAQAEAA